ncbi:magnetochrome domain-containing protein [Magnetovibrio sp. PR-2]|uniref:magnetochrome domain-containing protein n=1 Tax=Magnetovibrio sp. PR-2 TaxID=3120356 RepID=UPI002FCDEFE6
MKSEEWIISAGVATLVVVVMITMFVDEFWEDDYTDAPVITVGTFAPHSDGREKVACASCHVVVPRGSGGASTPPPPPPISANAPIPPSHNDGRGKMACKNCHQILTR